MRINKYDFETIQNRVDAARSLQDAGDNEECEIVLQKLAKDLTSDQN